ncbi:MAG TPA: rhodanese-like domain-containing protein [Microthrixaceae bacterium]|nr:rhodanese-like domain-containing protein [Microthrixaceae bacterium]
MSELESTHPPAAIDELLTRARASLPRRVEPAELDAIRAAGGLVVDTRPVALRERDGDLDGSIVVERNVLEWRLDPTSPHRLAEVTGPDQMVVVACDEGYASTLAAASLQSLGLRHATDLAGGFQAWLAWSRDDAPR